LLELTFTGRALFESLKQFFNAPEDFFFAESAQAQMSSLARARKLPINLIVDGDTLGTSLFVLQKNNDDHPILYREKMQWNFDTLFTRVAAELGVNDASARTLYRSYLDGAMSEGAARAFKKVIDPAINAFFKEITKDKLKGTVYMDARYDLPFALPYRRAGVKFEPFPIAEILAQLSFAAPEDGVGPRGADARHLLPFIEAYFDKSNSDINQKLRRRLHWLAD
jgi:hypothetical protein